jgi:hypothetical protein
MAITYRRVPALAVVLLLTTLAGCDLRAHDQMGWAREALQRNDGLEIVATDSQAGTFTVRVKDSGELRVVRADQVIAAPPPAPATSGTITAGAAASEVPATGTAATGATPGTPAEPPVTPPAQPSSPEAAAVPAGPQSAPSSFAPQGAGTDDIGHGKVLESGPGYSIKAADAGAASAAHAARVAGFTSSAVERRHEPIVCQGSRLVHIDNRNLVFDGDAVSAEDGCEIHITNSHISARGVGISARAANVHVDNSMIEGEQGSIDASEGAQVYVASSQFRGLSRRLDSATVHDLGGNVWN